MARFMFVTWPGGGNVHPLVVLGSRLVQAGHDVRVLGPAQLAPRFETPGMTYAAHRTTQEWTGDDELTWPYTSEQRAACLRGLFDDVSDEIDRANPGVLVVDFMQPDALCAAERSALPFAAFVHTLYTVAARSPFTPMEMSTELAGLNELRGDVGLAPLEHTVDLLGAASLVLVTTVPELDRPEEPPPANVRHVGPLLEEPGPDAGWTPPEPGPLVVVSMGTTAMDEAPAIQRTLDALDGMTATGFLTVGEHLDPGSFRAPSNTVVTRYVRHSAVMPHASVFVGHAGLGGINAALASGVPLVCVPLGRDQPTNAAHVEALGASRTVAPDASTDELRNAITAVLEDRRYAARAQRVASAIARYGNGVRAVEELERLL